ncbi:response regulator transcription factor [Peribacillus muralis]|uniref:response regulator transcription factor n=1 Tax=Peribacillus muralis TaxID=264697 RepID=UPI003D036C87
MKQVLVIKNERSLVKKIVSGLKQADCFSVTLHNEPKGLNVVFERNWDLIILDWDSLSISGPEICRKIRAVKTTPIIIVTDQVSIDDCIEGLKNGADDYIRKPFAKEELVARVNVILKRTGTIRSRNAFCFSFKDILVDESRNLVEKGGNVLQLTNREYDLLVTLIKNKNKIVSREMLLNQVWGYDVAVNPNVLDLYIGYLRKKLQCKKNARYIQTVHGRGYTMLES